MAALACLVLGLGLHPIHLTLTEIRYKDDQDAVQVSVRVFTDDLEKALKGVMKEAKLRKASDVEDLNEVIERYILHRFTLASEGENMSLQYLGAEMEEDATWIYMEVTEVRKLGTIRLRNEVLLEVYDDQENIVHFRVKDNVKSMLLSSEKPTAIFDWQDSEQ